MAVNTTTLVNAVQTRVDGITASCDNKDILLAAVAANRAISVEGHKKVSVSGLGDLPLSDSGDPASTVGVGHMVYVDSLNVPVVSAGNGWYGLDRTLVRKDAPDRILWTWGRNNGGQLGGGGLTSYSSPITTFGCGTNWKSVFAGVCHSLAIKTDGTLWVWGYNGYGALGTGDTTSVASPVTTAGGGSNWCQVSSKYCHSGAIKTDGTLWMWGLGVSYGQIGDGFTITRSSPVTTAGGGNNWCLVSTGCRHSGAIKTDGTLWMWGENSAGQSGALGGSSPSTIIGGGTTWCQVSLGCLSTLGIKTDGTLWVWGDNTCGQLGTNNKTNYSSPTSVSGGGTTWCQVSSGNVHTVAVKTDGTLWSWGQGTNVSVPYTVYGGDTTWCQVSAGSCFTNSGAVKTDGTLWVWGANDYGQLGTGNITNYNSPVTTVAGGTNWCYVSVGNSITNAITVSL